MQLGWFLKNNGKDSTLYNSLESADLTNFQNSHHYWKSQLLPYSTHYVATAGSVSCSLAPECMTGSLHSFAPNFLALKY